MKKITRKEYLKLPKKKQTAILKKQAKALESYYSEKETYKRELIAFMWKWSQNSNLTLWEWMDTTNEAVLTLLFADTKEKYRPEKSEPIT
jgi:hypothetical protein